MSTETLTLKRLPAGIHTFSELREEGYIYVDKTADIYRFVTTYKAVFLSRPRRFGKSLLISTLEELFKGNKPLFQDLAIYDRWDWEQKHPIVRIDWSRYKYTSLEDLDRQLVIHFQNIAEGYGVELRANTLDELIEKLHKKTEQRVVVLIDEYDKLMLNAISDAEKLEKAKIYLHSTYCGLKAVGEHIRFLFLTGVTKFSGLSIFSGLNNLNDITLDSRYATLCGYTQSELEENFVAHIEKTAEALNCEKAQFLAEIKRWYNGYSWDGKTTVYNPYSILKFFDIGNFSNFWFETGTPTFFVEIVKARTDISGVMKPALVSSLATPTGDVKTADFKALLFQTGYLTIKGISFFENMPEYTLDFPNFEVRESFLKNLLNAYIREENPANEVPIKEMKEQLCSGVVEGLETNLQAMIAMLPYTLLKGECEATYHMFMLLWLRLIGFDIDPEIPTDKGRIDAVWKLPDQIIVIEIKFSPDLKKKEKLLDDALAQIHSRGYAERYLNFSGKVSLLGVAFAGGKVGCRLEILKEGATVA